jgi:hypothetical protein
MAAAAPIAGIASIASLGLTVAGDITKGNATKAADDFQADRASAPPSSGRPRPR